METIQSIRVASYLDDPTDAVTIAAQFAKLSNGINHVTGTVKKTGDPSRIARNLILLQRLVTAVIVCTTYLLSCARSAAILS